MGKTRNYRHLNQADRDRIQSMLNNGHKQKEVAQVLGVTPATISREIQRNRRKIRKKGGTINGKYEATAAEHKALVRREASKYQGKKIEQNNDLRKYIIRKLKQYWNPDEISGRMKEDKEAFYAGKTAIYEWLRSRYGQRYCVYLYSRQYRAKKHRLNKTKRSLIPHRISITERPLGATNYSRYGHYEGDTIVSGKSTGSKAALTVAYEMKAKYVGIRKIKNLKPESHNRAMTNILENKKALSLTQDNGIENTRHELLRVPSFFCDPYCSWQKPGVENVNKMIRRFIVKGSDINDYSEDYVMMVEDILNNKPRKSLGYKTPKEVMIKNNLFTNSKKIALH